MLDKIIKDNSNISNEGLVHQYGIQTGRNIRSDIDNGFYGDDIRNRAAAASAGSDARMGGSALLVMTAAGSGNIGLTLSLPLIELQSQKVRHKRSFVELYSLRSFQQSISSLAW